MAQGAGQPDAGAGELTRNTDIVALLADASPLAKVVLLILLLFSAVSWAIILYKMFVYRRAERQTATFLRSSARAASSQRCRRSARRSSASPLVGLFQSGYAELNAQLRTTSQQSGALDRAAASRRPSPDVQH